MPFIFVKIKKGHSLDKKRELVKRIAKSVTETVDVPADGVHVILEEIEADNLSTGGILECDANA